MEVQYYDCIPFSILKSCNKKPKRCSNLRWMIELRRRARENALCGLSYSPKNYTIQSKKDFVK